MLHIVESIIEFLTIIGSMFTGFLYIKSKHQEQEIKIKNEKISGLKSEISAKDEQHAEDMKVKDFETSITEHEVNTVKQSAENNVEDKIDNSDKQHKVKVEL